MRRGKPERLTMLPSSARDRRRYYDEAWPRVTLPRPFSRIRIPIPPRLYQSRLGRPTWVLRILVLTLLPVAIGLYLLLSWLLGGGSTLVFAQSELQRIWQWEISIGHHPSSAAIPHRIGLRNPQPNAALRPRRAYIVATRARNESEFPSRPLPGSIADLDLILDFCDYGTGKYGRDCLETLRVGGGLDALDGRATEAIDARKYTYVEQEADATAGMASTPIDRNTTDPSRHVRGTLEPPLPLPPSHTASQRQTGDPCDPAYPRLFHMFWAGPFTDKPYMALLSFLFTQNLGLEGNATTSSSSRVCRPQFWVWIHSNGTQDIMAALVNNPWSAPFLHSKFKEVIKFQTWDTVQQLDSIPELKTGWRKFKDHLLNSGGRTVKEAPDGKMLEYDKPSVVLSDMARFVLCHRFGGIYLDADTLFLRDWEELWGWHGAFAYRWSWHDKYNTAVLRMHAGSALGSFLFRTALRNKLDFHPMTISKYLRDAGLDRLLLRLPDALFDPAFLTMERLQLDRPPFPEFQDFKFFFNTPTEISAAPQVVGFEGFFRGAYSYHWHNFWWHAFDSERNWPDLGPRFFEGEGRQRALLLAQERALKPSKTEPTSGTGGMKGKGHARRDLSWSTMLKRTFEAYVRGERPNISLNTNGWYEAAIAAFFLSRKSALSESDLPRPSPSYSATIQRFTSFFSSIFRIGMDPRPAKRVKLSGRDFYENVLGSPKFVVGPMVDQSELPWRILARRYGAELAYTPMINAKMFATQKNKGYRELNFNIEHGEEGGPEDRPLIVQFCANDPEQLLESAKVVAPYCDAVDINLGCPQDIAKRGHYGAFLQDDWDLVYRLINTLHMNLDIPVTAKFRVFPTVEKTVEYAKMLERAGAQILACHGRTREQRGVNAGLADWEKIKAVKDAVSVPVFANGNILFRSDIARCLEATGADAVMVAEGQLYNAAIFHSTKEGDYHPFHADLALEYLDIVKKLKTPTNLGAVKGHMFKIMRPALNRETDIRDRLGRIRGGSWEESISQYEAAARDMKERMERDAAVAPKDLEPVFMGGIKLLPHWLAQPYFRLDKATVTGSAASETAKKTTTITSSMATTTTTAAAATTTTADLAIAATVTSDSITDLTISDNSSSDRTSVLDNSQTISTSSAGPAVLPGVLSD